MTRMAPGLDQSNLHVRIPLQSANVYFVRNLGTKNTIMVNRQSSNEIVGSAAVAPRLSFQCNEGQYCALKQIWDGTRRYTEIAVPQKNGAGERLMEVSLVRKRK